jgi:hypothetical protein
MANILYRGSAVPSGYATAVAGGAGANRALTNLEIDQNFYALDNLKFDKAGGTISGATTINGNLTIGSSGSVTIAGDLTVNGTTTTINATTVTVDDINIELGSVASPTDATANGGGITLKGATDKTITWDSATTNWTSNQNWNIASGKTYKINGTDVLTSTALGSGVTSSSLTKVGLASAGFVKSDASGNLSVDTSTYSISSHTHSYAGSSSVGGAANSVANTFILRFDLGATEGTDLYTFNGSGAKTIDFKAGSNVSLTKTANTITINSSYVNTTYSASTGLTLSGTAFSVNYGTTGGTACQGNDSRLSDSRIASDVYTWAKATTKPSYNTSEISEVTNLYYTDARARAAISVTGSLGYNSTTGVISYTAPTTLPASDVYAWAKATTKPSYTYSEISNTPTSLPASDVYAWAKMSGKPLYDTSEISEVTNLYYTNARSRAAISVSGSLAYNSTTGVISYTTPASLPASDVYAWAKAATKPSYALNEISSAALTATSGSFSNDITIGAGQNASSINMTDSDEGSRTIHCNSNRIGFLNQSGGWGSYCNDDGSWTSDNNITAYSDGRLKENVITIDSALEKTLKLRGVYYTRKDKEDKTRKVGVIAQEIQEILPEVVRLNQGIDENDTKLSVDYGNITALLIEAIKELNAKVEDLQNQLANK